MSIAALISDLVKSGTDPELVGRVAEALASREPVVIKDEQAERRRANDRERKRLRNSAESAERDVAKEIPPTPPKENNNNTTPELAKASSSPRRRERRSRISENWKPSEREIQTAIEIGLPKPDIDRQAVKFRNHHLAKGSLMADWSAAWRTWCGNWREWNAKSPPQLVPAPVGQAPPGKHFVEKDTPQWRAWCASKGVTSMPATDHKTSKGIRQGWYMDTEWPPSQQQGAA